MTESTKAIASLKKAANYTKLAMHQEGPRSFKRGQGALIKVIYKFGKDGVLGKDEAKKVLGWQGGDVRAVAKKAADNGYLTIGNPKDGFTMTLTPLGTEVVKKRLAAEDKAADKLFEGVTDAEKEQLISLCNKISANAEAMGADYSLIQKRRGHRHGKKCCEKHGGAMEACHHGHSHGAPKYVFVFEEGHGHHHHHHHEHGPAMKKAGKKAPVKKAAGKKA